MERFKNNFLNLNLFSIFFIFNVVFIKLIHLYFFQNFRINNLLIIIISQLFIFYQFKIINLTQINFFKIFFQSNLIIILIYFLSISIMDISYDANAYHLDAIICLSSNELPWDECANDIQSKFFPFSGWIFSSVIFNIDNNLNSLNFLNLYIFFNFLSLNYYFYFFSKSDKINKLILIIASISNPVLIYQLFTNYNDITSYILTVNLIYYCVIFFENENNNELLIPILLTCIILPGIKFNTAVVVGLFIIVLIIYFIIKKDLKSYFNKIKKNKRKFNIGLILILITSVLFFYHPYLKNLINNNHLLHPILGENNLTWIDAEKGSCLNKNRFIASIQAKFADTKIIGGASCEFFLFNKDILNFRTYYQGYRLTSGHDLGYKLAGFGPMFALLIIVSLILFIKNIYFYFLRKMKVFDIHNKLLLFMLIIIMLLQISITSLSWSTRYVFFLWLLPTILVITLNNNLKINFFFKVFFFSLLIINFSFMSLIKYKLINDGYNSNTNLYKINKLMEFSEAISSRKVFEKNISKRFNINKNINTEVCIVYYLPYDKVVLGSNFKQTSNFINNLKKSNLNYILYSSKLNKNLYKNLRFTNDFVDNNELLSIKLNKDKRQYFIPLRKNNIYEIFNKNQNSKIKKLFLNYDTENRNIDIRISNRKFNMLGDGINILSYSDDLDLRYYRIFLSNTCMDKQ